MSLADFHTNAMILSTLIRDDTEFEREYGYLIGLVSCKTEARREQESWQWIINNREKLR